MGLAGIKRVVPGELVESPRSSENDAVLNFPVDVSWNAGRGVELSG